MEGASAGAPDADAQSDATREERAARLPAGSPADSSTADDDDIYVRMDGAPEEDEDEEYVAEDEEGMVLIEDGPDDAPPPDDGDGINSISRSFFSQAKDREVEWKAKIKDTFDMFEYAAARSFSLRRRAPIWNRRLLTARGAVRVR